MRKIYLDETNMNPIYGARLIPLSIAYYEALGGALWYKSKILIEKYRATLMNIFKIPVSIYFISVLFFLKQLAPLNVILIAFIMMTFCVMIIVTLITCPVEGDLAYKDEKKEIGDINIEDEEEKLS